MHTLHLQLALCISQLGHNGHVSNYIRFSESETLLTCCVFQLSKTCMLEYLNRVNGQRSQIRY
jgi:hypothetical protein